MILALPVNLSGKDLVSWPEGMLARVFGLKPCKQKELKKPHLH